MTQEKPFTYSEQYLNNQQKPLLLAHRGSRVLGPENTFAAFDIAQSAQADALEIDIRLSKDKQLLVFHDETLERVTNGSGKLFDYSLLHLKRLDAAYHFHNLQGEPYRGRRITLPTLTELLEAYPDLRINIDIKDNSLLAARLLAECIAKTSSEYRTLVGSFHIKVIEYFRQIAPEIPTAASSKEVASSLLLSKIPKSSLSVKAAALQIPPNYGWLNLSSPRFIHYLKQQQKPVHYWTINQKEDMRRLLSNGADGIVTDRIDVALNLFQEMGYK